MTSTITLKALVGGIIQLLIFPLALFLAAGTLAWPAGWVFLLLFYCFVVVTVRMLSSRHPALLEERMTVFRSNQKGWDKVFFPFFQILCIIWVVLMAFDALRFHWSQVPFWLQVVGVLLLIGAYTLMYLVFRENAFLTPTVRIQEERGQRVISTGPYHYVRHPLYSGLLLFWVGTALLLGSWIGLFFALILTGMCAVRAIGEERVLRQELAGYDTYQEQVHYRFVPRIW